MLSSIGKTSASVLTAAVLASSLTVPAFAASGNVNSVGSNRIDDDKVSSGLDQTQSKYTDYNQVTDEDKTSTVDVYATQASSYTVTVPATLILNGAYGAENSFNYDVVVSGNIAGDETVTVKPDSDFTMSSVGKDDIPATVTQGKTTFTYEDGLRVDNDLSTTGKGVATGMTAGLWKGSFGINISLNKTEDNNVSNPSEENVDEKTFVIYCLSNVKLQSASLNGQNIFSGESMTTEPFTNAFDGNLGVFADSNGILLVCAEDNIDGFKEQSLTFELDPSEGEQPELESISTVADFIAWSDRQDRGDYSPGEGSGTSRLTGAEIKSMIGL